MHRTASLAAWKDTSQKYLQRFDPRWKALGGGSLSSTEKCGFLIFLGGILVRSSQGSYNYGTKTNQTSKACGTCMVRLVCFRIGEDSNEQNVREVELSWLTTPRHSSACGHFGGILEIPVIPGPRLVFAHSQRRSTTKVCESFALTCKTQKIPHRNRCEIFHGTHT
jgi:hypothetical protein